MTVTLEELAKRVEALEREMAQLRKGQPAPPAAPAATATPGIDDVIDKVPMLREARDRARRIDMKAHMEKVLAQMGITGEPVGAEKLQAMQIAEGVDPNNTDSTRWLEEMRDEE